MTILIIDNQNRVLWQRRREGLREVPGCMALGESTEETGLAIGALTLVSVFPGQGGWVATAPKDGRSEKPLPITVSIIGQEFLVTDSEIFLENVPSTQINDRGITVFPGALRLIPVFGAVARMMTPCQPRPA